MVKIGKNGMYCSLRIFPVSAMIVAIVVECCEVSRYEVLKSKVQARNFHENGHEAFIVFNLFAINFSVVEIIIELFVV